MNTTTTPTPPAPASSEHRAILTLALLAAFADGRKHDGEREQIRTPVSYTHLTLPTTPYV